MLTKTKKQTAKRNKRETNNLAGPEKHVRRQQIAVSAGMRISAAAPVP